MARTHFKELPGDCRVYQVRASSACDQFGWGMPYTFACNVIFSSDGTCEIDMAVGESDLGIFREILAQCFELGASEVRWQRKRSDGSVKWIRHVPV
jgi:hypothetical protein